MNSYDKKEGGNLFKGVKLNVSKNLLNGIKKFSDPKNQKIKYSVYIIHNRTGYPVLLPDTTRQILSIAIFFSSILYFVRAPFYFKFIPIQTPTHNPESQLKFQNYPLPLSSPLSLKCRRRHRCSDGS